MKFAAEQLNLFGGRTRARYPEIPGHRGVATQIAAADRIEPTAANMRRRVLAHITDCGAHGATRQEIADALGMKLQTVCGRVRELVLSGDVTEPEGRTRDSRAICVAA